MALTKNTNFHFEEIKIYTSNEWMNNATKRYRTVFAFQEIGYIYFHIILINLNYAREYWFFEGEIRLVDTANDGYICKLPLAGDVDPKELKINFWEGYEGKFMESFWKEGNYRVELWSNDIKAGSADFYVVGTNDMFDIFLANEFFELKHFCLFEADDRENRREPGVFYQTFDATQTRYIYSLIESKLIFEPQRSFPLELTVNYFTSDNLLKGSVTKLVWISPDQKFFRESFGWGSGTAGAWYSGSYRAELRFMDKLIGIVPFTVSDEFIPDSEGVIYQSISLSQEQSIVSVLQDNEGDDALEELNQMIGLESVKKTINELLEYQKYLQIRKENSIEDKERMWLHSVFIGNPGTGKTTVARLLGKILKKMNVLPGGHVHEVDRVDLVGEYIGQTAPKVRAAVQQAQGGVLFIDEAYGLARTNDDTKDFGREAIEILTKEMSDNKNNFVLVAAGYPAEMGNFLDSNPGLKSRFNYVFNFDNFTPKQLMKIAEQYAEKKNVTISEEVSEKLYKKLLDAYRASDNRFGNARSVERMIDKAKINMGLRIVRNGETIPYTAEYLTTLLANDLDDQTGIYQKPDIPIDEPLLETALNDLSKLIGLQSIKTEINNLVHLVRYYIEIGKDYRDLIPLHSVCIGNPGTGKTTLARIIAQIYKALGVLEKGQLMEVSRADFIAGYVGQTAAKTLKIIEKAQGGVLFIDEAYNLVNGPTDSFGHEAVATLIKYMEDFRGKFIVIIAGYTKNISSFLESNPGFKSRFNNTYQFDDYNQEEMLAIALFMFSENKFLLTSDAQTTLNDLLKQILKNRDYNFGNARVVRKFVEQTIRNQELRMASIDKNQRRLDQIQLITSADMQGATPKEVSKPVAGLKAATAQAAL